MGLDAVELVLAVEETFAISIPDAVAGEMVTPAHLISYVQKALGSRPDPGACISLRAFHRVRAGLSKATGIERSKVRLDTRISALFSGSKRSEHWRAFQEHASLHSLPELRFGTGWLFSPTSVNDLVAIAISQSAIEHREERSWSDEAVRQVVRQIISEQLGIKKFRDTDEFIRDLGLD